MKELSLREVQLGELSVLKKLDEICEQLNLRYFLMYGTLLGTIRHRGFIPWDDDVDVMMPRPDYERLIDYLIENEKEMQPYRLMHYRTNPQYIYPIARLVDTRYFIDYQGTTDYGLGLFVDIYPMDGCGNTPDEADAIFRNNQKLVTMISLAGNSRFQRSQSGGLLRSAVKWIAYCYAKIRGARAFAKKVDEKGKKYSCTDNEYVGLTIWDVNERKRFKREWFEQLIKMQFEDSEFWIPAKYHEILSEAYGEYMRLPPDSEQIGHHYYTAYRKD